MGYLLCHTPLTVKLFLAIDLPKIADLQHTPPPFPNCTTWAVPFPPQMKVYETMGSAYVACTAYRELHQSLAFLDEAVHHKVCIQYKAKYDNLFKHIDTLKQNIAYKIQTVMPHLLPNERALLYGKARKVTSTEKSEQCLLVLSFLGSVQLVDS